MALRARRTPGWLNAAAAGCALGAGVRHPPPDRGRRRVPRARHWHAPAALPGTASADHAIAAFAGGFVLAGIPTLVANALITGSAFSFPYSLAHGSMFGAANIPFGLRNLDALLASSGAALTGWGWECVPRPLDPRPRVRPGSRRLHHQKFAAYRLAAGGDHRYAFRWPTSGREVMGCTGSGPAITSRFFAPLFLLTARGFFVLAGRADGGQGGEKTIPVIAAFGLFFALSLPAGAILPTQAFAVSRLQRGRRIARRAVRRHLTGTGARRPCAGRVAGLGRGLADTGFRS